MPVWHEATRQVVQQGKLAILGVTQEQHPERCALFAQWKQFGWPILHDPINVLRSSAVPVMVFLDEHGIVRATRPRPETFVAELLDREFADDADTPADPVRYGPEYPPALDRLRQAAEQTQAAADYRELGDALVLWGGAERVSESIDAYSAAVAADPSDGRAHFRLGVMLRERYESDARQDLDFQQAIASWERALEIDPSQYIWRRRIQQYGPRLNKPYPFYDWVPDAERGIQTRGDQPIALPVRPQGAEIASPIRGFSPSQPVSDPDPEGRIPRVEPGQVQTEVTIVPHAVTPGQTARIHIVFRLVPPPARKVHWNNEAEPFQLWLAPPTGWQLSEQLLTAPSPMTPVSTEDRRVELEVQVPQGAAVRKSIDGYALFHACDDDGGTCRYVRLDVSIPVAVERGEPRDPRGKRD